ncbi:MAG: hypothetical protein RLZZ237_696, partial [Pseudomonadota bacterium]
DQAQGADVAPFAPGCDRLATRAAIGKRKDEMLASPNLVNLPFTETLVDGLYTRTLHIPKGCELVGKIHRKPCVNIVAKGDITIMTETGCLRVQAGYSVTSPAGIQKIGYAHEDTIFINVFRTDVTDITRIEEDLISESFEAFDAKEKPCLG